MRRLVSAQGFVTAVGVGLVVLLALVGYVVVADPLRATISYCADMPDAVGLYPGNHVTMLGVPVGTVTAVEPRNGRARVEFTVAAEHRLRGEVLATTVSDTLVADRELEVLGESGPLPEWSRESCVTNTFTPKSISETLRALRAFSGLADQLNGGDNPADQDKLRTGLQSFAGATAGTGPQLNQTIRDLATALKRPDAAIGNIGSLIDSFATIMSSVAVNWADIETAVTQAAPGITLINEIWTDVVQIVQSLTVILPWLNNLSRKYGYDILNGLDETIPYLKLLSANVAGLQQLLETLPVLAGAFTNTLDPATGAPRVNWAPPKAALPPEQAGLICALLRSATPGSCRAAANGLVDTDLVPLVLGLAGAP
ncbi:MlaD family protein [Nocardia sp. XZ_19_385]|uniref:MlaD family protein n=1 Tax=Nocardia sp. XZ_19_385 TaxID=2769488 RepID=UPI00188DF4B4|nr:MlaD family protein [Nocardia sp. XZ_19_385]